MKKILFLLLLLPLLGRGLGGGCLSAQTVSNLAVMPGVSGSPSTVTFDVEWVAATLPTPWLDSMWVFVDYNKNGKMERLLISGGTLTEHTATKVGTGEFIYENDMGAWVYGDARTNAAGSFSAKVQLFTKETDIIIAGACAYASSYPPVGNWIDDTKIAFNGTPWYEVTLTPEGGGADETVKSGSTFLLPCSYTMSSFTDKTGAPGIINCKAPTGLMFAIPFATVCAGQTVTLTASATDAASYSINGTTWQTSPEFKVSPASTTHYTLYAQTAEGCITSVADAAVVTATVYPAISPGGIVSASTTTMAGINPNVTIGSLTDATGGSGSITYQWRRTGTSSATLTGNAATYTIGTDDYSFAGNYLFRRYAKDATCPGIAPVAAAGSYTLYVGIPTMLCEECCWSGATWVNCHVTTNAYPFDDAVTNTLVVWSGYGTSYYSGASSDKNGRTNTAAISSAGNSAVQICKNLGTGWYLPAYEELVNMSTGEIHAPLNGRSGTGILEYFHWSSTETVIPEGESKGRYFIYGSGGQTLAVCVATNGNLVNCNKSSAIDYVRCARQP